MSTAKSPKPTWKREFLIFFGSLKLAIGLILAIAAASMIGTVLPQDQGPGVVINGKFDPWLKAVMLGIQAYDVYHAFWFNFLLALMFVNLAVCTYLRYPPTWRRFAMAVPPTPPVAALQEVVPVAAAPTERQLDMLRKRGYMLTPQGEGQYFAEKAKFVRLGPTLIHISLFLIIAGAIVGGLTGIKNSFPLMVGETVSSEQIVADAYVQGKLKQDPRPFDLRLDAFRMEFRPNGQVKQYYSDLTVLPRDGGQPFKQTMWVNEPLINNGMYFYQSFWGVGALTYSIDGVKTRMPLTQAKIGGSMSRPFKVGGHEYMWFLRSTNEPCLLVSTKDFNPEAQLVPGLARPIAGHQLEIEEYHLFSGIETKKDPGIPLVYAGCGILILGLCMVPISHREVWIRRAEPGWVLAGRTHKGRVMLRQELDRLAALWDEHTAPPAPQEGAALDTGAPVS